MAKWLTRVEWDDVPHLTKEAKEELYNSYLPHEREARKKGIPTVGSGKVYPIPESDFVIPPFEIPVSWPRVYGMDVGWNFTSAVWLAYDEANDIIYIYKEYKVEQQYPTFHASAIRYKDPWIPGVVDPAAQSLSMNKGRDRVSFFHEYQALGLELYLANNSIDVGILTVLNRLSTGRLKVFNTCQMWLNEYRIYRRNDKGQIVKKNDDLMDSTRYAIMSGIPYARTLPDQDDDYETRMKHMAKYVGKNPITGY